MLALDVTGAKLIVHECQALLSVFLIAQTALVLPSRANQPLANVNYVLWIIDKAPVNKADCCS